VRRAAFTLTLALAALCGCATLRPIVTSPSEYDAYRRYKLARTLDDKLASAWVYLRDSSNTTFRIEVMRWFGREEELFFAEAGSTPGGASAYLKLMPDGPHAEVEATFLRAYEKEKIEAPLRAKKELEEARKRADAARKAAGEAIELWTRRGVAITTYREPFEKFQKVDRAVADALAEEPSATCGELGCSKTLYFKYAVPDASPPTDRVVAVVVRLEVQAGLVSALSITAPKGGFTWWLEGAEVKAVDPFDVAQREEALMRAKNRVETVVRDALKSAQCNTKEEPTLRTIDCGAVRVTVEALPNGDDVVRIIGTSAP
jgi:hypothetical protein